MHAHAQVGLSPSFSAVEPQGSNALWVTSDGYTQPTTLALADAASPDVQEPLKALPAFYDASGVCTQQHSDGEDGNHRLLYRPINSSVETVLRPLLY